MTSRWFFRDNGAELGPYSFAQLRYFYTLGRLSKDSEVKDGDDGEWLVASGTELLSVFDGTDKRPQCDVCFEHFPEDQLISLKKHRCCPGCKPYWLGRVLEGYETPHDFGMRFAGFWVRVGAKIIDYTVIAMLTIPLFIFSQVSAGQGRTAETIGLLLYMVLSVAIPVAYYTFFVWLSGATPGKLIFAIRVVNANGTRKIGFWRAFARFFACDWLNQCILFVGYMWVGIDYEKKGLHDIICKTRVVHR